MNGQEPENTGRDTRRSGGDRRWNARRLAAHLGVFGVLLALPAMAARPLTERLTDQGYLEALRRDSRVLRQAAVPAERSGEFLDVRCVMHAHSQLSHDSRGTEAELVAAAKTAGVRAVFMTEHPTAERTWQKEGLRGEKDGVLFIPGAELSDGLLVWRGERAEWSPEMKAAEVAERLKGTDGVAFVAHPEQRKADKDWELPVQGMEIYNTHADAEDSDFNKFLEDMRRENPLKILSLMNTLKKFQREAFASIFDEQTAVLKRWDTLNAGFLSGERRMVGIAANDAHQNVGVSFEGGAEGLVIKDALGKTLGNLSNKNLPLLLLGGLAGGGKNMSYTFDPYPVSFRYVSTHLLATEVTENALFDALLKGRAYVAFDWMANPSGFEYFATARKKRVEMGSDIRVKQRPTLTVRPNMPCELRLLRNGEEVQRAEASELTFETREPGVYRAEAWVTVAGEKRPWIYSNPIYVTPSQ